MQNNKLAPEFIINSVSYKLLRSFFLCFLSSATSRYAKNFAQVMLRAFKTIFMYSDSNLIFKSIYKVGRENIRSITFLTVLFVLICHLSLNFLMYKRIHYCSVLFLSILLVAIYCSKKNVRRYITSAFTNSVIFKLLHKEL